MKRKVIQIAESTQLISLPRKWCIANSVKKGDEIEVEEQGSKIIVSCKSEHKLEHLDIHIRDYGILAPRLIYSLYKKGIDEIKIHFDSPEDLEFVQKALHEETTVGYELVEQDSKSCLIKNISSNIMGFDNMLRRTFLLLITLADESAKHLKGKQFEQMKGLVNLEQSNNKFTTLCRRYLNKYGGVSTHKIGPLYAIIEELEKIADEYKYLCKVISSKKEAEIKVSANIVAQYQTLVQVLHDFYESFYKFDPKKLVHIGEVRKQFVHAWQEQLSSVKNPTEFMLMHHSLVILQKTFNMLGPLMVLAPAGNLTEQPLVVKQGDD